MSDQTFVYSTLTNDQKFTKWSVPSDNNIPQAEASVLIKGGANMSSGSWPNFVTPHGVATPVNDDELELLLGDVDFKKFIARGFITYRKDKVDPEVAVAAGMQLSDDSAPKTPESPEFKKLAVTPSTDKVSPLDKLKGLAGR